MSGWQQGAWQKSGWAAGQAAVPAPAWNEAEQSRQGELLWAAVPEAVASLVHLEKEWDSSKLEKKLREYFTKAGKGLAFRSKSLQALIEEYTDNAMGSIFAGLGDREWLYTGQADFILVLDAGIKDCFPPQLISQVEQHVFEQMVLSAYDRAFEEQRFGPLLSEAVSSQVQGPKTRKKVWNAIDAGRKEAMVSGAQMEDFVSTWIGRSVALLAEAAQGSPDSVLNSAQAAQLFHTLVEGGALPLSMAQESGPPPPAWPVVDEAVQGAYMQFEGFEESGAVGLAQGGGKAGWGAAGAPPTKRQKNSW